ncbi:MAG: hypothetical protein A2Y65_06790 [Deltaproteobacteria bacterium RBG_13_52_11]|nr:MAG: hypothetical protein A2Y65_06790 [Deltaproteobacteria bacterium RBG_13_52_11]
MAEKGEKSDLKVKVDRDLSHDLIVRYTCKNVAIYIYEITIIMYQNRDIVNTMFILISSLPKFF